MRSLDPAWFVLAGLVLVLATLLWIGWDATRQARRITDLEGADKALDGKVDDLDMRLNARVDRLQGILTEEGWRDSKRLTTWNWRKPSKF